MKKFTNLLKKEIKELITRQLIGSLILTLVLFYFIGNIARSEMGKVQGVKDIYILDLDESDLSGEILRNLAFANFRINQVSVKDKDLAIDLVKKDSKISLLLIIPKGFASSVSSFQPKEIETYSFIRSFSMSSSINSEIVNQIIVSINNYLSDNILKTKLPDLSPKIIKNPIRNRNFIVVKDRIAEGSITDVNNFVYSQSIFVPIILMMIIVFSSQMVLSAIAMEKQDKTLETLLTVPISRNHIVIAKMLASGIVGLVSAGIYMIGFRFYMGGFMGNTPNAQVNEVVQKLNLRFTADSYILLGISLFLAILCALALATILGVLTEDLKSAQSASFPLVFLVLIPYFLTILSDINSLELPLRVIVLAIPFTHPFLASQNLIFGNYAVVLYGILYMLVVFMILVFIAGRIFSTDRILTMKLGFRKRFR
jgi:ABC-2 type transport system permease protein